MTGTKKTLIKNGTLVIEDNITKADILIQNEKISAIGNLTTTESDIQIDAKGLLVLPGAVDTHVHFNDAFMNTVSVHDYYTGTLAAAYGGVTSVVDFSNQIPGQRLIETLKQKKREAEGKTIVDWGSASGDHPTHPKNVKRNTPTDRPGRTNN